MRTIEAQGTVKDDRILTLQLPEDGEPGEHEIIVTIKDEVANGTVNKIPLQLNVYHWGSFPPDCTFRREDIYDDDGR